MKELIAYLVVWLGVLAGLILLGDWPIVMMWIMVMAIFLIGWVGAEGEA